ncbi:MAG TPA: hypothetical protein VMU14_20870, partial [Acidimicrobiales bacterium]|nr:hypothetical protein [Acidimicrobiales bacterium]
MPEVVVLREPDALVADEVRRLAARVSADEGRDALREDQAEALTRGGPGWAGVVQRAGSGAVTG